MEPAPWGQGVDEEVPGQDGVGGIEDKVEPASQFFQDVAVCGVHHMVGTHLSGLGLLARTRGERRDLAAPFVQELQGHVPQSANADDPHPVNGQNAELYNWIEDRDPAAEQRTGVLGLQALRQGAGPQRAATHVVGKAAMSADNGPEVAQRL